VPVGEALTRHPQGVVGASPPPGSGVGVVGGPVGQRIVEAEGLRQVTDTSAVEAIVRGVIEANPVQVSGYRSGKVGLKGFLVGQVMKQSGGKANPGLVNELLDRLLAEG